MRINTLCVRSIKQNKTTEPHQLPIYASSSFLFESAEQGAALFEDPTKGHIYSRFNNPTSDGVAEKIKELEIHQIEADDSWSIMTSSGMSAIATLIFSELNEGDGLLTQSNLYGGTTELFSNIFRKKGIKIHFADLTSTEEIVKAMETHRAIKAIYFETPSNPSLDCVDIQEISTLAHKYGAVVIVDNTFCTPILQQPFKYGVDYVIHSTTKYINGHGNATSGIIVGRNGNNYKKVWMTMKLLGTNCNPWDAWLVGNGIKTLALRMERHSQNGMALAKYLVDHPNVASVNYLGLTNHRFHNLAKKQMDDFGGMLCFEVKGGMQAGIKFMNRSILGSMAPTMGDIDTLIMHPASMSHVNIPKEIRLQNRITDSLIRVSVGLEDIEDLKEDFDQALS